MRADYELFNQQLCILGRNELKIFRGYLSVERNISILDALMPRSRLEKMEAARDMLLKII